MSESRRIGRDVSLTFGGRVALTAAVLVGDVILARTLGPDGKGAFTLILALSSLGALVLGLGFDRSLAVMAGRSIDLGRKAFANAAIWTVASGIVGVFVVLALYGMPTTSGGTGPLGAIMPPLTTGEVWLVALALPFEIAFAVGLVGLLGRERLVAFNVLRIARRAVLTLLLIAIVLAGRVDLPTVLVLNLVALAVTTLGIVIGARWAGIASFRPDTKLMRQQISFGGRAFLATVAERLHYRVDTFLLTALITVGATGVYSVAIGLAETMWYLPVAAGQVLFSRAVQADRTTAENAATMARIVLTFNVVLGLVLFVASPTLIELVYGAPFRDAAVAFQLMLPGVAAYSVVSILSLFAIARGVPGRVTVAHVVGVSVNVAANLVLIPAYGINGAGLAATISYTTTAVLIVALFTRLTGVSAGSTVVPRRSDLNAVRRLISRRRAAVAAERADVGGDVL